MKTLGSSGRMDVKPNEAIPVGWEQYYSLPDFKKRWRRVGSRAK